MKFKKIVSLLFTCLLCIYIYKILFCSAIINSKRLFTVTRNKNNNMVVYDIQMNNNGTIMPNNPIKIYWLIYKQNKFVYKNINNIEEKVYGVKILNKNNDLVFILKSIPSRTINIKYTTNGPKAEMYINYKRAYLSNIYVYATNNIIPKVIYYVITGIDIIDGKTIEEKVYL